MASLEDVMRARRSLSLGLGAVLVLSLAAPVAAAAVAPVEPVVAEVVVEPVVVAETQPAAVMDASGCPADLTVFGPGFMTDGLLKVVSSTPFDLYVA